jgi:hypothetical protein
MASQKKRDRENAYRSIALIALLYSIVFVVMIAVGYYFLLGESFIGAVFGAIAAAIAFSAARLIGNEDDGIKANLPLFIFLLLISAVGVFNTLMLTLEGRQIFTAAISSAERQVEALKATFETNTPAVILDTERKIARIESKQKQLEQEIRNPNNCGQGPAAQLIIDELARELDGFKKISQRGSNPCANAEDFIASYAVTIPASYKATDWYKGSKYDEWLDTKNKLTNLETGFFPTAIKTLRQEQVRVNRTLGPALVGEVKPVLERLDSQYREAHSAVGKYVDVSQIDPNLDLLSVRSVGEWSQLINLVIDNLNKPTTYVYPTLAVFADWLMIYLFQQVRRRRTKGIPTAGTDAPAGILR